MCGDEPPASLLGRRRKLAKFGDVVVPFNEGRNLAEASYGMLVERPDLGANRMIVRVEQIGAMIAMAGEVELSDPVDRNGVDINPGIELMVEGVHIDIVDVEQNSAVRLFGHRGKELPFAHRRKREFHIARNVLD